MYVEFNSLNRLETPVFTLCNPGCEFNDGLLTRAVGVLADHEAEEIRFNFNSPSELSMRVNLIGRDDQVMSSDRLAVFNAIQNRRLIYVSGIGFFVITNISDDYRDYTTYKDITASSCEVELQQKTIPYIGNTTYRFLSGTEDNTPYTGILNMVVGELPLWSIGHVDETIAQKWRTFEDVDTNTNCLSFLIDSLQASYECIILFDIIHRIINVYDQDTFLNDTSIHLTRDDLIDTIDIKEDANDIYTALSVFGENEMSINSVNPLGTSTIYNFDHYLDWMSDGLRVKVQQWKEAINDGLEGYRQASMHYFNALDDRAWALAELDRATMLQSMYEQCRDNIIAESSTRLVASYNNIIEQYQGTAITIQDSVASTISDIDSLLADLSSYAASVDVQLQHANSAIDLTTAAINDYRVPLQFENFFTASQYEELKHYIFEGQFTDEYSIITDSMTNAEKLNQMSILYNRGVKQLEQVSEPTREFSIDTQSFVFERRFLPMSEQLETGCLVNIELQNDELVKLFLSGIIINYDDHTLQLKFGNRFNKYDIRSLYENALGNITKTANSLSYVKNVITPLTNGEYDGVKSDIENAMNITMGDALTSNNQEIIINGAGYTGRMVNPSGGYYPEQIKILNNSIVMTSDSWQTANIAIGKMTIDGSDVYGINADVIVAGTINANLVALSSGYGGFCCAEGSDGSSITQGAKMYGSSGRNGDTYIFVSGAGARMQCKSTNFHVTDGSIHASTQISVDSDRRLKQNIRYDYSVYEDLFGALKPAIYQYVNDQTQTHCGFIAQDVEKAIKACGLADQMPALLDKYEIKVPGGDKTSRYALRYDELIAVCVHMIQKLQTELKELKEGIQGNENDK